MWREEKTIFSQISIHLLINPFLYLRWHSQLPRWAQQPLWLTNSLIPRALLTYRNFFRKYSKTSQVLCIIIYIHQIFHEPTPRFSGYTLGNHERDSPQPFRNFFFSVHPTRLITYHSPKSFRFLWLSSLGLTICAWIIDPALLRHFRARVAARMHRFYTYVYKRGLHLACYCLVNDAGDGKSACTGRVGREVIVNILVPFGSLGKGLFRAFDVGEGIFSRKLLGYICSLSNRSTCAFSSLFMFCCQIEVWPLLFT